MISESTVTELQKNLIERVCVGDITTRGAALYPDKAALIDGDRVVTYRQLDERANRLGHALLGLGLQPQSVVAVMAGNCAELLEVYFACAKAGLICAPVNLGLRGEDIAYCLRDASARVLVVQASLVEAARALPEALPDLLAVYWTGDQPEQDLPKGAGTLDSLIAQGATEELEVMVRDRDAVQLLYTSGTTANPKGVLTSHLAVTLAGMSSALSNRLGPQGVYLAVLPMFHCAVLNSGAMSTLTVGGTMVIAASFDALRVLELIQRHQVSTFVLLPMMYAQLLNEPRAAEYDTSSVVQALYAMAPMPEERLHAIHALFPGADVVLGSGQTEFTPPTCLQRSEHQWSKAASWGTATAMTRVAIMDEHGNLLPNGEIGEIVYRGPMVMNGYLNQTEQTAECFRHGWFHSGDVAWMDEDGAIWFTDRKKDVIKTGGENVASVEVERCLMGHPAVAEAAVIGLPHERWGEAITAVVICQPEQTVQEEELMAYCRDKLAGFKVPKAVLFAGEFPRTGTGKIQKHVIRSRHQSHFQST